MGDTSSRHTGPYADAKRFMAYDAFLRTLLFPGGDTALVVASLGQPAGVPVVVAWPLVEEAVQYLVLVAEPHTLEFHDLSDQATISFDLDMSLVSITLPIDTSDRSVSFAGVI